MNIFMNMRSSLLMLLSCAGIVVSSSAFATSITNMADIPFDIDANLAGEEQVISIEPGKTWTTQANPISVQIGKRRMRLEPGAEYTVWKDGTIAPQRRSILDRHR